MRTVLLAALLAALVVPAAQAATHRLVYEGPIQTVSDPAGALTAAGVAVAAGDRFRVDVLGTPGGTWSGAATIGDTIFHEAFSDAVIDDGSVGDELVLGSAMPYAVGASGITVDFASVRLVQADGTVLDSNAFPAAIDLADWSFTSFSLGGFLGDGGERFQILGSVDTASLTAVPEPSGAALLALGLAALAQRRGSRISASCATDAMRSPSRV